MRIKITIPQIRCRKVTHPRTDADEIYMDYFVSLAKDGETLKTPELRKYISKHISNVKYKVKRKKVWMPENMHTIVETGDARALYLTMGLYEYDNGRIYRKLLKQSDVLINPDDFDWNIIELPTNITSIIGWVKSIWKLLAGSFNYFMEDDLLGTTTIAVPDVTDKTKREWVGQREFKFKAWGGDYRVTINIEVLNE